MPQNEPIIGKTWGTTEPKYRKPDFRTDGPGKARLYKLTAVEIDVLDALSLLGRASSRREVWDLLKNVYGSFSTIEKNLTQLWRLGCASRETVKADVVNGNHRTFQHLFAITTNGTEILNEVMDVLEARMIERGDNGIRRERKRS